MIRQLWQFLTDESGGVVDTIVTIGLLVIIVGGVLYAINGGMQEIGNAAQQWICEHFPRACS
jgi:hypothetical protein